MEIKIDENRKTILFAPNAFGKTTLSIELYEDLTKKGVRTELFTAKRTRELVNVKRKEILIGDSSINKAHNIDIEDFYNLKFNSYLSEFAKNNYKANNATQLNSISTFFSNRKLTNFRKGFIFFKDLIFDKTNIININLNFEEIISLDKELYGITVDIPDYSSINFDEIELSPNTPIYTDENYNSIQSVLNFIRQRSIKKCPVCGSKFESNADLIKHVLNEIKRVNSYKQSVFLKNLILEWDKIEFRHRENSPLWKIMNKPKELDVEDILKKVIDYDKVVRDFQNLYKEVFIKDFNENSKIDLDSLKKDAIKFNNNLDVIEEEDRKIESNDNFMRIVCDEFAKLVDLPDGIDLYESKAFELKVRVNGKDEDPYEVLSESELKRLSLAIIKATIIERHSGYLILDDPIDSYDDFYIRKATEYINTNLLSEVNKWLITSHQFQFIQQLANELHCNKIDALILYGFLDPNYINLKAKIKNPKKEVQQIRLHDLNIFVNDEMILLKNIANNRKTSSENNIDKIFAYLSMVCILRTFKNELVNGIDGIIYVNDRNRKIQNKLNLIEDSYLHYSIDRKASLVQLEYILEKWLVNNHNLGFNMMDTNKYMNDIRDKYLTTPFDKIKGKNIVLKDVLFKMLWVSKCKYELDRSLYVFCCDEMKWNSSQLRDILNKKTFNSKLKFVQKNIKKQTLKLKDIEETFNRHKALMNDYSHSASRLFPPYMVTSIKEISAFYNDIQKLFRLQVDKSSM